MPSRNGNGNGHAVAPRRDAKEQSENIFLFYPNLIGYARIVLATASLWYMPIHPRTCSALYSVSCLLDALDGWAARKFNQSTKFGGVLDMVTDRCTTSCLLVFLASAFPRWSIIFQGLISLDLASHYMHMYATLTMGEQGQSHKNIDGKRSWLLRQYYSNKAVLFTFCALNEVFFIALYLLSFSSPILSPDLLKPVAETLQPPPPKPSMIFTSPWSAGAMELARYVALCLHYVWSYALYLYSIRDYLYETEPTVPWILTIVSLPIMAGKQWINVVQLVKASRWLAEGDVAERKRLGLNKKK